MAQQDSIEEQTMENGIEAAVADENGPNDAKAGSSSLLDNSASENSSNTEATSLNLDPNQLHSSKIASSELASLELTLLRLFLDFSDEIEKNKNNQLLDQYQFAVALLMPNEDVHKKKFFYLSMVVKTCLGLPDAISFTIAVLENYGCNDPYIEKLKELVASSPVYILDAQIDLGLTVYEFLKDDEKLHSAKSKFPDDTELSRSQFVLKLLRKKTISVDDVSKIEGFSASKNYDDFMKRCKKRKSRKAASEAKDTSLPDVDIDAVIKEGAVEYVNEMVYPMNKSTRGYCLIIHMSGKPDTDKDREPGNKADVKMLKKLFNHLEFAVEDYSDFTIAEINELMGKLKKADHMWSSCFVMFILAHGGVYEENGSAYFETADSYRDKKAHEVTTTSRYNVSAIKTAIESITDLHGIPKLLFVQSCRGDTVDIGHKVKPRYFDLGGKNADIIPSGSDFLTSFATITDCAAYRGKEGSSFMRTLDKVFRDYYTEYDVMSMMTVITKRVADIVKVVNDKGVEKEMKQNPETTSSFRKFLYFEKPPGANLQKLGDKEKQIREDEEKRIREEKTKKQI